MGVHLSKVRSANLDTWLPEQVAFVAAMGNGRAAVFWEARLPPSFERPRDGDMRALSVFINQKRVSAAPSCCKMPSVFGFCVLKGTSPMVWNSVLHQRASQGRSWH